MEIYVCYEISNSYDGQCLLYLMYERERERGGDIVFDCELSGIKKNSDHKTDIYNFLYYFFQII